MQLIRDALDGKIDTVVATGDTGECKVQYNEARQKMTDIIRVIMPTELENNTFLYDNDDSPKKKKKKAAKKVEEKLVKTKKAVDTKKKKTTKKIVS